MIYKYLQIEVNESLEATAQLHIYAIAAGASIIRVHDPKSAKNTIELYELLKKS